MHMHLIRRIRYRHITFFRFIRTNRRSHKQRTNISKSRHIHNHSTCKRQYTNRVSNNSLRCTIAYTIVSKRFRFSTQGNRMSRSTNTNRIRHFVVFTLLHINRIPPVTIHNRSFIMFIHHFRRNFTFNTKRIFNLFRMTYCNM